MCVREGVSSYTWHVISGEIHVILVLANYNPALSFWYLFFQPLEDNCLVIFKYAVLMLVSVNLMKQSLHAIRLKFIKCFIFFIVTVCVWGETVAAIRLTVVSVTCISRILTIMQYIPKIHEKNTYLTISLDFHIIIVFFLVAMEISLLFDNYIMVEPVQYKRTILGQQTEGKVNYIEINEYLQTSLLYLKLPSERIRHYVSVSRGFHNNGQSHGFSFSFCLEPLDFFKTYIFF